MSNKFTVISGGVCAAKGFRANGLNCGFNPNKAKNDLGLVVSDKLCDTAAVYTQNKVKGAPIYPIQQVLSHFFLYLDLIRNLIRLHEILLQHILHRKLL